VPIKWKDLIDSYDFDTGSLLGTINPYSNYHGLSGLMHRDHLVNLVRPAKSFLNAEYYIRSGANRKMLPRQISAQRNTTHESNDNSVAVHFPTEPEYALGLDLIYTMHDDTVDMQVTVKPSMDVPAFELFFASYVCEALDETWAMLASPDGSRELKKLPNRSELNVIHGVMRSTTLLDLLPTSYPQLPVQVEQQPFAEPILVARDSKSGLALVFLCDDEATKYLTTQYHRWDTAHDWSFTWDLTAGTDGEACARLICRTFREVDQMQETIEELWSDFQQCKVR